MRHMYPSQLAEPKRPTDLSCSGDPTPTDRQASGKRIGQSVDRTVDVFGSNGPKVHGW